MRYAMVESGVVTNLLELDAANAEDFPGVVPVDDGRLVMIGDEYVNEVFTRGGEQVLTKQERTIAELDAALLDAEYNAIVGGLA